MLIFNQLKNKIAQYIDVYIRLFKIILIGRIANLLGYFMFAMTSMFIALCIVLFLGLGLVEFFICSGLSKAISFFLTIGVYLLLLFILALLRKKISRFFASKMIKALTAGDEDDEDGQEIE